WIQFYFRDKPQVDIDDDKAIEQLTKVQAFRKQLNKDGLVTLYDQADGVSDKSFKKLLEHQLRKLFQEKLVPRRALSRTSRMAQIARRTKAYRQWLAKHIVNLDAAGLAFSHGQSLTLNHVYVPATTAARPPVAAKGAREKSADNELEVDPAEQFREQLEHGKTPSRELILKLIGRSSLYVAGQPGSGKSTFCKWLAYLACLGEMPATDIVSEKLEYVESFPGELSGRLPLVVRLREFWSRLNLSPGCRELSAVQFEQALCQWLDTTQPGIESPAASDSSEPGPIDGRLDSSLLRAHLDAGTALLIFDGVDEVPTEAKAPGGDEPAEPRQMLLEGLIHALPGWTARGNRVLVTSRPYGLTSTQAERLGVPAVEIEMLDDELQQLLVRRWFTKLRNGSEGEAIARTLTADLQRRGELRDLRANPLLLTAICVIYQRGERLPENKHELYELLVDNVLRQRFGPSELHAARMRLSVIAYGMHTGEGFGESLSKPLAEITGDDLKRIIEWFQSASEKASWKDADYRNAEETRERLLSHSGLLLARPNKRAGFYHFTFQDYLAARRLLDLCDTDADSLTARVLNRVDQPEWRITLSFLFNALFATRTTPDRGIKLWGEMLAKAAADNLNAALVAHDALEILRGRRINVDPGMVDRFREVCVHAIEGEVPIKPRLELASALSRLGDPRVADDLRNPTSPNGLTTWVTIPAGTYYYGVNREPFSIPYDFQLSRWPVTNAQFQHFVDDGGYAEKRWWTKEGWEWRTAKNVTHTRYFEAHHFNAPTQPVVGVSWYE
ncbi:MAG TPA: NACHT domain-containing protein, partial [Pirellulaceae bacterium]|nr:NACHT domain-containing protein [Pirellulaceae bacterium]